MDFNLTEDQVMMRDMVRKLVRDKIEPRAAEIDATGEYPYDILEIFRKNDLMGVDIEEEYGGAGFGLLSCCVLMEEIAKICASSSLIVGTQDLGSMPIQLAGTEDQKKQWLPGVASGESLAAFALTEPGAGSDAAAVRTTAIKDGDSYILNGEKCFITNGGLADIVTVFAKSNPDAPGIRGLSCFVVEKGASGFSVGKHEDKMGIRGSNTASLIFEDCRIPADNLIGRDGRGFQVAMMTLDRTRPAIGAQAVGIAQGALDQAVKYSKERVQFGQPLAKFQALQFMMADMAIQVEAARSLVYRAASQFDGLPKNMDRLPKGVSKLSAIAKVFAGDTAMSVATDAVQLLGGYGYMKDYPVERMMRDAKITQIYEGTNQVQRVVIASSLLRE